MRRVAAVAWVIAVVVALVLGGVVRAQDPDPALAKRPNVVFLLADDLGWRDLGCTGSTFYETPEIDRLAESGVRFSQAYAACPVCSPTRAAVLAGKYPARMATTEYFGGRRKAKLIPADYVDRLPLEEVTLAEALRGAGYRTGFFGKWHLGAEGFHPEQQGFDLNVAGFRRGSPPGGYFAPYKNPSLEDGPDGEQLTERLTAEAIEFMRADPGRPFLLYLSYYSVHTPLQARPELIEKYRHKRGARPAMSWEERWQPEGERHARQVQDHPTYAAMVETLDRSVGRILATLEELGVTGETVVVFTSDNGGLSTSEGSPTSNEPLRAGKGWLYEGGVRVPLLLRWPGVVEPGGQSDVPVISTDYYPTLLAMAHLPPRPSQHVDGVDLTGLLRGGPAPSRDALFWHYPHYGNQGGSPSSSIRVGRYKLIDWFETSRAELFDLAADPGETTDLAAAEPVRTELLLARLNSWRESVGARLPRPNPDHDPAKVQAFHRRADRAALGERRRKER